MTRDGWTSSVLCNNRNIEAVDAFSKHEECARFNYNFKIVYVLAISFQLSHGVSSNTGAA